MYIRADRTAEKSGGREFVRPMLFGVGSYVTDASLSTASGFGGPDTAGPRIPLSAGEFGRALGSHLQLTSSPQIETKMRREIIRLLRLSHRFMRMVHKLDQKYIAFAPAKWPTEWTKDWGLQNGLLTSGPHRGRRLLEFNHSHVGSSFTGAGNPDARNLADILAFMDPILLSSRVRPPTPRERPSAREQESDRREQERQRRLDRIGRWIGIIAHETTHAFHFVAPSGTRPQALADRVRASLGEERDTRSEERAILAEIRGHAHGDLRNYLTSPLLTMIRSIERDFFPSALRRTYLEHFVLTGLLQEAMAKVSAADRARIDQRVDAIPLENRFLSEYLKDRPLKFFDPKLKKFLGFSSDYGRLRFILRIIDARWRKLEQSGLVEGTMEHGKEKERILRGHWRAFFGGSNVGYSK